MQVSRTQAKTLGVFGGLLLLLGIGLWIPLWSREARLRSEIEKDDRVMSLTPAGARSLGELAMEVAALRETLDGYHKHVPEDDELAELLRGLGSLTESRNVSDLEIETDPIVKHQRYSVIPIRMRFSSSFLDLYRVLEDIDSMHRLVQVKQVKVDRDVKGSTEPLRISVSLSAYFSSFTEPVGQGEGSAGGPAS